MRLTPNPTTALTDPDRREGLRTLYGLALMPLAALGACGTPSGGPSSSPWPHSVPRPNTPVAVARPSGATPPVGETQAHPNTSGTPSAPPIETERRWLEEWFGNTPVVITQTSDNTLQLSVPMAHSFAAGRFVPRPALTAVLDRVAESLRRQAAARLSVIAAPDAGAPASLGINRGHRIIEHIISRRVMPDRINTPSAGVAGRPVLLQLRFLPPPIM